MDVVTPVRRDAWVAALDADPGSLAFQHPDWLDAIASAEAYEDATRLYVDGSRRLLIPLVRRTGLIGTAGMVASLPFGWGFGGAVASDDVDTGFVEAVIADLAAQRWARLSIRPSPTSAVPWAAVMPPSAVHIARRAHVLDLQGGFGTVWATRFTSAARRYVRHAEHADLEIEKGCSSRELDAFYQLYLLSVARWADMAGPLPARWWTRHRREDRRKFEAVVAHLGDRLTIWVARHEGHAVASIIVLHGPAIASYWRGAMDEAAAGRTRANYLLQRYAIEDACAAGCRAYHMGETGSSGSLAQFKTRFGARPVDYRVRLERVPITAVTARVHTLALTGVRIASTLTPARRSS